jgi:HEAT repeats
LLQALEKDPEAKVRTNAAKALGRFDDVSAVPGLREALEKDPDVMVRAAAALALGKFSPIVAAGQVTVIIEALIKALEKETDPSSYVSALDKYSSVAPVAVAPKLIAALTKVIDDPNAPAEATVDAASALGKLGQAEAVMRSLHRGGVNSRLLDLGEDVLVANFNKLYCYLLVGEILKEQKQDTMSYPNLASFLKRKGLDIERSTVSMYMKAIPDLFQNLNGETDMSDEEDQGQLVTNDESFDLDPRKTYGRRIMAEQKKVHEDEEKAYFRSKQGLPFKMFRRGWQMWEEVRDYFAQVLRRPGPSHGSPASNVALDRLQINDNTER